MSAFNPERQTTEYGQLDALMGGHHGTSADDIFLGMLDDYDQEDGSKAYGDHDGMVGEMLDALNRRLHPIGLDATRSGVVYCNAGTEPDREEVDAAVRTFKNEDWAKIVEIHADWDLADHAWWLLKDYGLTHGNTEVSLQNGNLYVTMEAPNHATISLNVPVMESDEKTIMNLKAEMIDRMGRFDADEEFTELWSKEFAEHNGFTPSGFMKMLQDDEKHFHGAAVRIATDYSKEQTGKRVMSLTAEAKASRDASQALDGHDAPSNEHRMDR